MRSLAPAIPLLTLLLILCFTAACTIPFFGGSPEAPQGEGSNIRAFQPPVHKSYWSMSSSLVQLREHLPGQKLDVFNRIPVYYVQGADLDADGDAARWTFAVNLTTGPAMIVLENDEITEIPWGSGFTFRPIQIDQILMPKEIFEKNHDLIFSDPAIAFSEQSEITLRDETYTLSIVSNGTVQYLMFNARTGELVE